MWEKVFGKAGLSPTVPRPRHIARNRNRGATPDVRCTLAQAEKCAHCKYPPSIDFPVCSSLGTGWLVAMSGVELALAVIATADLCYK